MYDSLTGGVCDGLNTDGMNCNQGAESVVCFLMALSSLNKHINKPSSVMLQSEVSAEVSDEISEETLPKRKNMLPANNAE
jgi:hypothetical protein